MRTGRPRRPHAPATSTPGSSHPARTTSWSRSTCSPGHAGSSTTTPVESVEDRADGGLRVRLRTADTAWLRQLVLQLGGGGRVVDPPELAAAVAAVARGALDAYEVGATEG